jgi:hypothetical protein
VAADSFAIEDSAGNGEDVPAALGQAGGQLRLGVWLTIDPKFLKHIDKLNIASRPSRYRRLTLRNRGNAGLRAIRFRPYSREVSES